MSSHITQKAPNMKKGIPEIGRDKYEMKDKYKRNEKKNLFTDKY